MDPVPTIKVVFGHEHSMDGDRRKWTEGVSLPVFVNAYNATASKSAVMSSASQKPSKPVHYVLFLDTQVREHGEVAAVIGGLSLMLIPTVTTSDIVVTGSLYEAATGKEVAVHEAKGELKLLIWLPLLPVTPFTLISAPGKELYEDTFRDFFMMLTKDLTGKPLPEAVEPSRIVSEPVPDHPKREIRLK